MSVRVRTYFNFLDNRFGKGCFMLFLCMITFEKTSRGEDLFGIISSIVGVLNILVGYNDHHMKIMPSKPWGEGEVPDLSDD
jgi:hypothetical protein